MYLPSIRSYPKTIQFGDEEYRLRFVRTFSDATTVGECDPSEKEIRIKLGQGRKETFRTLLHELLHLVEFEHPIEMKHATIYKLEEALFTLLTQNL